MEYSETHLQFFQVLDRLKRMDWSKQFETLKPPEFFALCILSNFRNSHPDVPGMYVSAFAKELNVPAPAASKLLNILENNGWITRMIDPSSRRNTFIVLTEAGRDIHQKERDHSIAAGQRIFDRMGTENTTALLAGINQILSIIEEEFQ